MEKTNKSSREQLMDDLSDMSEVALEMLQGAIKALDKKDIDQAKEILNRDDVLANYQVTIEEEVSRLLGLNKPVMSDRWLSIALIKISTDLERIGDYATNIAEIVLELKDEEYIKPLAMIPELSEIVSDMLDAVLEAFITGNVDLAEAACRKDERADNIYDRIYEKSLKLIDETKGTQDINQIIRFVKIAKALERIGDHATNIGEETIFVETGKRVKY